MALILHADGSITPVEPKNGKDFTLEELQGFVGGYIELCYTHDDQPMYIDEEGKIKGKPINVAATLKYRHGDQDPIVGDVVLGSNEELGIEE